MKRLLPAIMILGLLLWPGTHAVFAQAHQQADSTAKCVTETPLAKSNAVDYLKVTPLQYRYYDHLGAACKMELRFEQTTKVPLRLRLGSLQQTDYMEQKPNAIKPSR